MTTITMTMNNEPSSSSSSSGTTTTTSSFGGRRRSRMRKKNSHNSHNSHKDRSSIRTTTWLLWLAVVIVVFSLSFGNILVSLNSHSDNDRGSSSDSQITFGHDGHGSGGFTALNNAMKDIFSTTNNRSLGGRARSPSRSRPPAIDDDDDDDDETFLLNMIDGILLGSSSSRTSKEDDDDDEEEEHQQEQQPQNTRTVVSPDLSIPVEQFPNTLIDMSMVSVPVSSSSSADSKSKSEPVCSCQLLSLDCLHTIQCLYFPNENDEHDENNDSDVSRQRQRQQKQKHSWALLSLELLQAIQNDVRDNTEPSSENPSDLQLFLDQEQRKQRAIDMLQKRGIVVDPSKATTHDGHHLSASSSKHKVYQNPMNTSEIIEYDDDDYDKYPLRVGGFFDEAVGSGWRPLGKELQYATTSAWLRYTRFRTLPLRYANRPNQFMDPTLYGEDCGINRQGLTCFFQNPIDELRLFSMREGGNDDNTIEHDAITTFASFVSSSSASSSASTIINRRRTKSTNSNNKKKNDNNKIQIYLSRILGKYRTTLSSPNWQIGQKPIPSLPISFGSLPSSSSSSQSNQGQRSQNRFVQQKKKISPLGQLLVFANLLRLHFQRKPFLERIYQERIEVVKTTTNNHNNNNTTTTAGEEERQETVESPSSSSTSTLYTKPFVVSLHLRRGDSCGEIRGRVHKYEDVSTLLDTEGQVTGKRKCYKTHVYLDEVRRIRDELVPPDIPIVVHLSTDDNDHVMDEIKSHHAEFVTNTSLVQEWKFLNYSRQHFQYKAQAIEFQDDKYNMAVMGESAVVDLWHLSFGDVFVGHLGSRFGKVAWLLSTARHGMLVPYKTVDGHTPCCEIDESCGLAIKSNLITSVEECLAFSHEFFAVPQKPEQYWSIGSMARQTAQNMTFRNPSPGMFMFTND